MRNRIVLGILAAQSVWAVPVRYKDAVFTRAGVTSDIKYGSNKDAAGNPVDLLLDLYRPAGDTLKERPLMIWIHGGGFTSGAKTDAEIVSKCTKFAMKGYVTASLAYRLGTSLTTRAAMSTQILRAVQDGRAAVRYLRAHKAQYGIDDTRILMGGTSAGGVLSLIYAYLDEDEIPAYIDTNAVGGIEGKSGTPGVSSAINGIINCWGSVWDTTMLYNAKLPVMHFHGTADPTVPVDWGYALGNPALTTGGSKCIHRVLTRETDAGSTLKLFEGMGHGIPNGDKREDTLVTMTTQFAYDVLFPSAASVGPRAVARGLPWMRGPDPHRGADGRSRPASAPVISF